MQEQSTMEVDRLSHHPCHRLSVPAAKLFWCRHCMEKFEDPISRWRHSKTCKTEGTLNMNKRKEQEAEAFKLFVESTTEPEQETEMDCSPQLTVTVSPPEKVPSVTQQTGTDLSCIICKKEFTSLDDMRAHVRTPCNKQDKHSDGYNRFPFISNSFRTIHMESGDMVHGDNEFDSLFSVHGNEKPQNKEEVLIAKLLSQWSEQKVSYKQPSKEMKYKPALLKSSTTTSLDQSSKYMQTQSSMVFDTEKGDKGFSPKSVFETCIQTGYISKTCKANPMSIKNVEIDKDFAQQDSSHHNHKLPEKNGNLQEVLKNGIKESQYVNSEAFGVMQQNLTEVRRAKYLPISEDNTSSSVDGEPFSTNLSPANVNDVSKTNSDSLDSFSVKQKFEQSDKENHVNACSHVSKEDNHSVSLKCVHPVTQIPAVVSSVINCDYTSDQSTLIEPSSENKFTVLKDPEFIFPSTKNQENENPVTKICSSRKYKSVKVSKNKPKPVRAVVPIVNTGVRNTEQDDSDNDSTESVSKYQIYPPSPAKTRSKQKEPPFCSVRSTARTLKPTQKKLELMVKQKSKSKLQIKENKQKAIKEQIANKKPVKKSVKGSEKQTAKKQSIGKEAKLTDKKKLTTNTVMFHQLNNEKSRSKPPKNLKCRLCDRIFDSVKQYQNHTRIPCKMKITRKWSQKVLRPNRSLPPAWKPKPGKRKNKEVKKPNIIPNNFRIHSQWEPNKRIRKTKTKNRPASPQLSIVESSREKQLLPHQQVEVSDLTQKELFLFHLGLMCSDDLPLNMCIKSRQQHISQPLAVSIDTAISDNLSDCYISPPVLERIDVDEDIAAASVASVDLTSNLEPPHLIPAVLYNDILQTNKSGSERNMLSYAHNVTMTNVKVDKKSDDQRNIFDVISVVRQLESNISDHGSSSPVKNDKEIVVQSSRCKALNSPSCSQKSPSMSHTDLNGSKDLFNTKPLCFKTKPTDDDVVISPQRKEKRNLFESLGWKMLPENSDLSLTETKQASPLKKLAQQRDSNIVGLLSERFHIQSPDDSLALPVKNTKPYLPSSNSPSLQTKFALQQSVLEPLKTKLLKHFSPGSFVPQVSPNASHHLSPVVVPTPRRPTIAKSPARYIPQDAKSPVKISAEVLTKNTGKCNQELLTDVSISKTTVTSINHIVRKLQFNSSYEITNTVNESSTDMASIEGSGLSCNILSPNSHDHHDDMYQNTVQIHVLHKGGHESIGIEDLLADMVQTICSDLSRKQDDVHMAEVRSEYQNTVCQTGNLTKGQCTCHSAVISDENFDTNLCSCAQTECLSNKSTPVIIRESCSGSVESPSATYKTDKDSTVYQMYRDETEECNGDFDEVDGDTDGVSGFELGAVNNMDAGHEESSEMKCNLVSPDVTVEYVDQITSEMLDDSDDVTYIIIEQNDMCDYIDSVKEITNTEDGIAASSFVSVS